MTSAIKKGLFVFIATTLVGTLIAAMVLLYFNSTLPKIATLHDYNPPLPSQILSKDGTVLAEIGKEKRKLITIDEIPDVLVNAFLSAEDDNFYHHAGFDYMGFLRAVVANIKAGRFAQGGSTITQQVAKSLLLSRERSISRKIKDILLALKIEKSFSKKEILFLYLNQVYLGGGYYGVRAATEGYFNKDIGEVSVAESAMLAGLLVAPGKYSPYISPKAAKMRQHYVLGRMLENQYITKEQYLSAKEEKIKYRLRKSRDFLAGYFTDWMRRKAIEIVGDEESFLTGGYKVHTTLDWELQKEAEKKTFEQAQEIDKRQGYKGPIRNIPTPEEVVEFEKNQQKQTYEEKALYFVIGEDFEKENDIQFNDEEFTKYKEEWSSKKKEMKVRSLLPGYSSANPYLEYIDTGKLKKAVVTEINNSARLIFVSVDGIPGIIPYEHFRWAHEREIQEEYKFHAFVTRPSSILKIGDIVWVTVLHKQTKLHRYAYNEYKERFSKEPYKELKKENYLLCRLDQYPDVQLSLFSVETKTGNIISMVGGVDFEKSQFNRVVQSKRQPGSAFKPMLFAAALENNYLPNTIIIDSPESLAGADASLNWKPRNYDGKFKGEMTLRSALEVSRNVPTIKIAYDLGVKTIKDFVSRIKMDVELEEDLSLALGSFGITLQNLVTTYAIFPNGGKTLNVKSLVSIEDRKGNIIDLRNEKAEGEDPPDEKEDEDGLQDTVLLSDNASEDVNESEVINPYLASLNDEQVYDERLAYIMTNLLKGVVHHGTGKGAKPVSLFLGGKTGTTNNYVDAWFLGFSNSIVTGAWAGFDDNTTLGWGETGAKSALPLWIDFMTEAIRKYGEQDFRIPKGIINVKIDKETGKLANESTSRPFLEAFVEGTEPKLGEDHLKRSVRPSKDTLTSDENTKPALLEEDDYYDAQ